MCDEYAVKIKNRIITVSDWLSWRQRGLSNTEIAAILKVSPSMVRIAARKFRDAGVSDPQYWKRKPGPVREFDTTTDAGSYVLGILWGTASPVGSSQYWVRHRDKWYIDTVRNQLGITAGGHQSYSNTDDQWRLKIARAADAATARNLLQRHGWSPRNAFERPYPNRPLDDRGFVRAWVELHASADVAHTGRTRAPTPRLRIYGNWLLLQEINRIISIGTGLRLRKPQKTSNENTVGLYYTGKSFVAVVHWLYAGADLYNPTAKEKLIVVLRSAETMQGNHKKRRNQSDPRSAAPDLNCQQIFDNTTL